MEKIQGGLKKIKNKKAKIKIVEVRLFLYFDTDFTDF